MRADRSHLSRTAHASGARYVLTPDWVSVGLRADFSLRIAYWTASSPLSTPRYRTARRSARSESKDLAVKQDVPLRDLNHAAAEVTWGQYLQPVARIQTDHDTHLARREPSKYTPDPEPQRREAET